jgi:hypothetical protein
LNCLNNTGEVNLNPTFCQLFLLAQPLLQTY